MIVSPNCQASGMKFFGEKRGFGMKIIGNIEVKAVQKYIKEQVAELGKSIQEVPLYSELV